jgi:type IV conjugative transfer system protein TraE
MDPANSRQLRDAIRDERNFLRISVLALFLILLVQGSGHLYQILNEQTHLIPSGQSKPYVVGRGHADKEYLRDLAYDVMALWGNVTPDNIVYIKDRLLKMADAEGNAQLRTILDVAERRIKANEISTVWSPRDAEVDIKQNQVVLRGFIKTYLNNVPTSNKEQTFIVQFHINNAGRAYVRKLLETQPSDR